MKAKFRQDKSIALYQKGVLSLGQARRLARVTRWEFEELLGQHKIPRHYTEADLKEDIQYGLDHSYFDQQM